MSVLFAICLPLETFKAVQTTEGREHFINQLGNIPKDYHLIHDVTRNVLTAVDGVPYNIVPKANIVPNANTVPKDSSPTLSAAALRDYSPPSPPYIPKSRPSSPPTLRTASPQFSPPSPPLSRSTSYIPASFEGSQFGPNDVEIEFTIRDLMNKEEGFNFGIYTDLSEVAFMYEMRTGLSASSLTFTYEDGLPLNLVQGHLIGDYISDGAVILVKPKTVHPVRMIVVTVRDLMLTEQQYEVDETVSFSHLVDIHAERTGCEVNKLTFKVPHPFGEDTQFSDGGTILDYDLTVEELGIDDGSVITVHPKREESVIMEVTICDAMDRVEHIKIKNTAELKELESAYLERVGMGPGTVVFNFDGYEFGGSGWESRVHTKLSEIDIRSGDSISASPVPKTESASGILASRARPEAIGLVKLPLRRAYDGVRLYNKLPKLARAESVSSVNSGDGWSACRSERCVNGYE